MIKIKFEKIIRLTFDVDSIYSDSFFEDDNIKNNQKTIEENTEEYYEQLKQSRFQKVRIKAFSDQENAHTLPIKLEDLKNCADTIYDIPITVEFTNCNTDGLGTHSDSQIPIGFIHSNNNPIIFEKDEKKNKTFLIIDGTIWKNYSKNFLNIIMDSKSKKKVSVEIGLSHYDEFGNKLNMHKWVYNAVTVLSDDIAEGCYGAEMQIQFSKDKENYFKEISNNNCNKNFYNLQIKNTLEFAVKDKWINPRNKLLSPILKAKNKNELLNDAYTNWNKNKEKINLSDVVNPHHIIKNNSLVIQIEGLKTSFCNEIQKENFDKKIINHYLKHYEELGLNQNNYLEFNFSLQEYEKYFTVEGENMTKNKEMESQNTSENTSENMEKEEAMKENDFKCGSKMDDNNSNSSDNNNEDNDENDNDDNDDNDDKEKEMSLNELKGIYESLKTNYAKLEDDNKSYMAKLNSMSDYEELKQYKADKMAEEIKQNNMCKMDEVINKIEEKGYSFSDEDKKCWKNKLSDYSNMEIWTANIKAYAFDKKETSNFAAIPDMFARNDKDNKNTIKLWD